MTSKHKSGLVLLNKRVPSTVLTAYTQIYAHIFFLTIIVVTNKFTLVLNLVLGVNKSEQQRKKKKEKEKEKERDK